MAYVRKTKDEYQLLSYYGSVYGWECILTEDSQSEARKRKKEYMENQPEYPYRIKKVRVPIAQ